MKKIFIVLVSVLILAAILFTSSILFASEQCSSPKPAEGWVCQDGGWLPPGHPWIRKEDGTTPTTKSRNPFRSVVLGAPPLSTVGMEMTVAELQQHAMTGEPLPNANVWFNPPLLLKDIKALKGQARTVLIAAPQYKGPIIVMETSINGSVDLGYPARQLISDISIQCTNPDQTGLVINGAVITIERMQIFKCDEGLSVNQAINVQVRDSLFNNNRIGIALTGYGPSGLWGPLSITTIQFTGTRVAGSTVAGVKVGHGIGIIFSDSSIFEGNSGVGLLVEPTFPGSVISVLLRDVWLEANGKHVVDPLGVVKFEGFTGGH